MLDKIEKKLVEILQQKELKVGDSIPKELELAQTLGVSRTVIREALLRLRMMGLLESKKKKGAVITSPDIFAIMSKSSGLKILNFCRKVAWKCCKPGWPCQNVLKKATQLL